MTALPEALVNQALLEAVCWRAWPKQGSQRLAEALQALRPHATDEASAQAVSQAQQALQLADADQATAAVMHHLSVSPPPPSSNEASEPAVDFVAEALDWLEQAEAAALQLEQQTANEAAWQHLKRALHSIKGGAGLSARQALVQHMHQLEQQLAVAPERVAWDDLLAGLDQARTLLTGNEPSHGQGAHWRLDQAQMDDLQARCDDLLQLQHTLTHSAPDEAAATLAHITRHSKRLAQQVQALRLQPLQPLLDAMQRVVRDAAKAYEKEVHLRIHGGQVTLDAGMVQALREPLGHLLRNAVAHGIESAAVRQQHNKPRHGQIELTVSASGRTVQIDIADDGAGIDEATLRTRAGLGPDAALITLLAQPGLSTSESANLVAGRGMGVHAAQQAIQALAGALSVEHEPQRGCRWRIRLPQSLALQSVVHVSVGPYAMLIPTVHVLRVVGPGSMPEPADPPQATLHAHACFGQGLPNTPTETTWQVWLQSGAGRYRLLVDGVHGVHDLLIRPTDPLLAHLAHVTGHARLPDNRVLCVVNPDALYFALNRAPREEADPCVT
ncbi:MAG: ATP-binding protein [Burkholderiaceae bacterium]